MGRGGRKKDGPAWTRGDHRFYVEGGCPDFAPYVGVKSGQLGMEAASRVL